MSDRYAAASGVVYGEDGEILDESAATPDIEKLDTEADGKDWFVEVMGILDEEFVNIFAGIVGWGALRDGVLTVLLRVDIGWTARKEHGLAGVDKVGDGGRSCEEGNFDSLATAALDGGGILGPRALVVGEVSAGWYGDGDAGLHVLLMI